MSAVSCRVCTRIHTAFPTDEFKTKFVAKEIYKVRIRNYILESLENKTIKSQSV